MPHQLDPVLGQQRLPVRGREVPLATPVQHPMSKQDTRSDQPVIGRVQQRDRDLVRGIVADSGHQMMQTKIRIDQARRRRAVRHVVVALTHGTAAGPLGGGAAGRAATGSLRLRA